jgi:hypothetical protein
MALIEMPDKPKDSVLPRPWSSRCRSIIWGLVGFSFRCLQNLGASCSPEPSVTDSVASLTGPQSPTEL